MAPDTTILQAPMVESHPLQPFLPEGGRVLLLGSFPPAHKRWSMEWFYPNWINDMWRIMGLVFYGDRGHFEVVGQKRFDKDRVVGFCAERGIALYDTACRVRRLRDNASDKFLEVIEATDIESLLARLPQCTAIVTTGQKATELVVSRFGCEQPSVGGMVDVVVGGRMLHLWRMPSSSRAYPLAIDHKAAFYRTMLVAEGVLQGC